MKVVLSIGEKRTTLDCDGRPVELGAGWDNIARAGLEAGIAAIEDELMRVRPEIPGGASFHTADPVVAGLARAAGVSQANEMVYARDAVEQSFQRLAGRDPSIPSDRRSTGTLVILRELMHHLGIKEVRISGAAHERR
jgi:hypothetical protein